MVAAITGASSGIGAAFARRLAAEYPDLLLIARRQGLLEELATELQAAGAGSARVHPADLACEADLASLEGRLAGDTTPDLLINNAGFGIPGGFAEVSVADHLAMVRVHIEATIRLTRAVLPGMCARGSGAVINVASIAAFFPLGSVAYHASKAYLVAFSRALDQEVRPHGVRVQALCPGFTLSGFHDTEQYRNDFDRASVPRWMWLTAEQVVEGSLRDLARGRVVSIPGFRYRAMLAVTRLPGFRQALRASYRKRRGR